MTRAVRVDRTVALADPAGAARVIREALADYQALVVRGAALDPVVTELVRLRCARSHDCRICQTLRLADAADAGVDEDIVAKVDNHAASDLPDRVKVALEITDALIGWPHDIDEALVNRALANLSQPELAELCLDVTKWATQKINVALGLDAADGLAVNADGVALLRFDEHGRPEAS